MARRKSFTEVAVKSGKRSVADNEIQIALLRHGCSRAGDEKVHEGGTILHSRKQADPRRGIQFDAIIASRLVRTHETARIIGAALDIPIETDPE